MSHRKFEKPRSGSLGFLPRKRTRHVRGKIKSFPKDDQSQKPHLTAFIGYKAGMTHVVREVTNNSSVLYKKEIVEAVTIIETPPMRCVGIVGYKETINGLKALTTQWAQNISDDVKRRFYKNWHRSKKAAFKQHTKNFKQENVIANLNKIKKYSTVIRALCHT